MTNEEWTLHHISSRVVLGAGMIGTGLVSFALLMNWRIARASRTPPLVHDYLLQKDFPKAIEHLRLWLHGNPKDRQARFRLGVTLARAGRRAEAMATMKELTAKNDFVGLGAQKVLKKMKINPAWGISAAG